MSSCCRPGDYERFFNKRFAHRVASSYRKRGLDRTAQRMMDFLKSQGIEGATVLEIGGGVGEIEIELLKSGAARAQNLELSPAFEVQARNLAEEAGFAERVDWRIHNIAENPEDVEPADIVVLHRVVCCYPNYERLLAAAAKHVRRALVFSYPRRNVLTRAFLRVFNLAMRVARSSFRSFAHPPEAMLAVLERDGLRRTYEHRGPMWQLAGHVRSAGELTDG
jgi:magnesium-protoporphyrin O-methyltransferase